MIESDPTSNEATLQSNKDNGRFTRGLKIANIGNQVERMDEYSYRVLSQSGNGDYAVLNTEIGWVCSCPDYIYRGVKCKHVYVVEFSNQLRKEAEARRIEPITQFSECIYCGSPSIVRDGVRHNKFGDIQKFNCKECGRYFTFNLGFEKMKHNPQAVTTAMQLYFSGESLRNTMKSLRLLGVKVSHQTVYN